MTTTIIPFNPAPNSAFQFQATLDGSVYTIIVTSNLFGQRWYANIYTLAGVLVLCIASVGSPPGYNISLTKGYFTTQLVWRPSANQYEVIDA